LEASLIWDSLVTTSDWLTSEEKAIALTTLRKQAAATSISTVGCAFTVILIKI
jgi:hypothetical protein